jgi:hypothetical protein
MGRQLRSSATAVVVTFSGALAPRVAPAVAARAGAPPPSIESVWVVLVRQIDCASSAPMAARVLAKIRT